METAICVASGPSVTKEDIEYIKGKGRIYAVNEMAFEVPFAHVAYAADYDWWDVYRGLPQFQGEKYCPCSRAAERWNLNHIQLKFNALWGKDDEIASGGNSGFQALNLAVLQGAKRVILMGYDMGHKADQPKHSFDPHRPPKIVRDSNYSKWIQHFHKAAPLIPVPVFNTSLDSNLDCFQKIALRDII